MKFPALVLGATALLSSIAAAQSESPNTNSTPPGQLEEPSAAQAQPETPAPAQPQTRSAPGGQSPNGANGINLKGKAITKTPNTPRKMKKSPDVAPASSVQQAATAPSVNTSAATASVKPAASILTSYLDDLSSTLKLSASEKTDIKGYYEADSVPLQNILNDPAISPLKQAQQVSDLRNARNAKIEALLADADRQRDFFQVEANYRVALIESAARGGLTPPGAAPAAVPTPADTAPGDANVSPNPDVQPK